MISIDEAQTQIRQYRLQRQTASIPITESTGKHLAREITAPFDPPRFDNSAMDGYAVRWGDVKSVERGGEVELTVAGESSAGGPWNGKVARGQAVRINTGAEVPDGADTVIPVEHCTVKSSTVLITEIRKKGDHIRQRGEEFQQGDRLLEAGTKVNPAVAGLLASVGKNSVACYRAPRIALMVTGSELVVTGDQPLKKGQIYDSNRPMLYSYLKQSYAEDIKTVRVQDYFAAIRNAIAEASEQSGMIITTGGVSVGPHDHIPRAAEEAGFQPVFHHVAQKPGKPFFFATSNDTLFFGLPGNPVSAFMTFTWYIYPELCYYLGNDQPFTKIRARLNYPVTNERERSVMMRMRHISQKEAPEIASVARQGSHMLQALTQAKGFVIVPPQTQWEKGETVTFYPFP